MNGKRATILAVVSLAIGYLLGFYQVTPAYLYALNAKPTPTPAMAKTPQAKGRTLAPSYAPASSTATAEAQPTPWPAPPDWSGR